MKRYQTFAVIVYVTDTEEQAVMRMFDWAALRVDGDAQDYNEAFIEKDGRRLRVICARQDEMGMTASAALTTKMICLFTPDFGIRRVIFMWNSFWMILT